MSTTADPSDLTESQWKLLEPWLPPPKPGGRNRSKSRLEVLHAIVYLTATGGAWRTLPQDFPNWNTVFGYFNSWNTTGVWEPVHHQ